jgi:hypothetical protein
MGMNRIQFQSGLSLEQFQENFGTEEKCEKALEDLGGRKAFGALDAANQTTEL